MSRASRYTLDCPVKEPDGSPCGEPILVSAHPGDPGTRWDPPTGPEIEVLEAKRCDHFEVLNELTDEHFLALEEQLAEQDGAAQDAADDAAYDAAQESEIERERERWADLP